MGGTAARTLQSADSSPRRRHLRGRKEDRPGPGALPRLAVFMNAQYYAPEVEVAGLQLHAAFDIQNTSGETWRHSEGFCVGYHVFDPETDTLVVDGARTRVEEDRAHLDMRFDLPSAPGRYRVFVSPMRENVAWYYEQGWRFLLIDAVVAGGRATIERVQIATRKTIARERFRRTVGRIFTLPLLAIWRNRGLIRTMVR